MKLGFRIGLSVLLLAILLAYVVDLGEVAALLRRFDPLYLIAAIAVITIDRVLMAYKWTLLLKAQGHRLPLLQAVTIYCTAMVWGLALPATVGADAIRAVMVTRRGYNGTDVVTSIVIERLFGFVLALALALVSLLVLRGVDVLDARFDVAVYGGVALLAGAIVALVASMNEKLLDSLVARLPGRWRESKITRALIRFASAYRTLGSNRGAIVRFSVLTAIEQSFAVAISWILARGLGVPADLLLMLGVLPIAMLVSRLPITVDGLGVYEAVFIGLLLLAGISAESALAIAVAARIVHVAAFLPWWLVYAIRSGGVRPPQVSSKEVSIN